MRSGSSPPKTSAGGPSTAWEIQGWLYRTRGEKLGTIVLVHGGPTSHAEDRFNAQIQYLASRGFDVLAPNYRGSTGFGLPFRSP